MYISVPRWNARACQLNNLMHRDAPVGAMGPSQVAAQSLRKLEARVGPTRIARTDSTEGTGSVAQFRSRVQRKRDQAFYRPILPLAKLADSRATCISHQYHCGIVGHHRQVAISSSIQLSLQFPYSLLEVLQQTKILPAEKVLLSAGVAESKG